MSFDLWLSCLVLVLSIGCDSLLQVGALSSGSRQYPPASDAGRSADAGNTGYAGNAGSPGTSDHAGNAGSAGTADHAGNAGSAGTADHAGAAGSPGTADHAGNAGSAGTADHAGAAGSAGTADHAGAAGSADKASYRGRVYDLVEDIIRELYSGHTDSGWRLAVAMREPAELALPIRTLQSVTPTPIVARDEQICPSCSGIVHWSYFALNSTATPFSDGTVRPPKSLAAHPGEHGEYAVAYWTAPTAGLARIRSSFTGLTDTTTDTHVFIRGEPVFSCNIDAYLDFGMYTADVKVQAGDSIAFAVGFGRNRTYYADATRIEAGIELKPDPI